MPKPSEAWIFISHASSDLANVRKVRNYLEDKGASPLLFHLRSLTDPAQFWPIIEREIEVRNFFLYCESEAARSSEWVRREREVVERIRRHRPVRVGAVDVDVEPDTRSLDKFLAKLNVFPIYSSAQSERVAPYLQALRAEGFSVTDLDRLRPEFFDDRSQFLTLVKRELNRARRTGWHIIFISDEPMLPNIISEVGMSVGMAARTVLVHLGSPGGPGVVMQFRAEPVIAYRLAGDSHPSDLPRILLSLPD
ncbi:TIR domain-containing protein [Sphingomonas sp. AOB5]|uniref:TIR domain-containing protein n=1 Tax=Sphingomonas sp. AOB5 TaxID=3034017 RepID=UPI0023F664B8|nr:TIR domain-containing protein [Sphingomonas sp. AOB5]MDF7777259.1 TIR domain-containing protein [Sphingomonas sp. AOB5]